METNNSIFEEIKPYFGIMAGIFVAEIIMAAIICDLVVKSNAEHVFADLPGVCVCIPLIVALYYLGKRLNEKYNLAIGVVVPIVVFLLVVGFVTLLQMVFGINIKFWFGIFDIFITCIVIFSVIAFFIYDSATH